jgi:hypothetical protein
VGAGVDALSASYAQVVVYRYLFPRAVVAVLYGTGSDAGMAVYAFILVNPDDRGQISFHGTLSFWLRYYNAPARCFARRRVKIIIKYFLMTKKHSILFVNSF